MTPLSWFPVRRGGHPVVGIVDGAVQDAILDFGTGLATHRRDPSFIP